MNSRNPTEIKRRLAKLRAERRKLVKRYKEISPTIWLMAHGDVSEPTIEELYKLTEPSVPKKSANKRKK